MIDHQVWPAMIQVSNNSNLTKDVAKSIIEKLDEKEKADFLLWINSLVKHRIK